MLQPLEMNSSDQDRNKHKFMVQSAFVPDGETSLENIVRAAFLDLLSNDHFLILINVVVENDACVRADGFEIASNVRYA